MKVFTSINCDQNKIEQCKSSTRGSAIYCNITKLEFIIHNTKADGRNIKLNYLDNDLFLYVLLHSTSYSENFGRNSMGN